jgi:hypothetical protein
MISGFVSIALIINYINSIKGRKRKAAEIAAKTAPKIETRYEAAGDNCAL